MNDDKKIRELEAKIRGLQVQWDTLKDKQTMEVGVHEVTITEVPDNKKPTITELLYCEW